LNLLRSYNLRVPGNILFGIHSVTEVGKRAKELKGKKALIVPDRMLAPGGAIDKVKKGLTGSGIEVEVYDGVVTEPTTDYGEEGSDIPLQRYLVSRHSGESRNPGTAVRNLTNWILFPYLDSWMPPADFMPGQAPQVRHDGVPNTAPLVSDVVGILNSSGRDLVAALGGRS